MEHSEIRPSGKPFNETAFDYPDRPAILSAILQAVADNPSVLAVWEGGAAGFDRIDEWSDIDLQMIVEDDYVEETFRIVEQALTSLSPIRYSFRLSEPTWHGHSQTFSLLEGSSPFLMIDLVVMKRRSNWFGQEEEIHGRKIVHLDREGVLQTVPLDHQKQRERIEHRQQQIAETFPMFQALVLKEIHRGNAIEALQYYHGHTLRPLLELLRMQHLPERYNFHTRYIYYELPKGIVERLHSLFFVADLEALEKGHADGVAWVEELLSDVREESGASTN